MTSRQYYASECYGNFGVFHTRGTQVGGWWPTMELAEQAAHLANTVRLEPNIVRIIDVKETPERTAQLLSEIASVLEAEKSNQGDTPCQD
jgi:hypothetical protein